MPLIPTSYVRTAEQYIRRTVSLYDYFYHHPSTDKPELDALRRKFRLKSKWTPQPHQISNTTLKTLDGICDTTQNVMGGKITTHNNEPHLIHHVKPNLNPKQLHTIKELRNNPDIIIKPADKGGAIVVMDTCNYRNEALRQLNNQQYYRPLEGPIYTHTADKINKVPHNLFREGYISTNMLAYLKPNPSEMNSRYFYLLPKIHKSHKSWPHPKMPPGRPIVSDVNTKSSRICSFIDHYLQPHSSTHEAYTKDTYHFIQKIRGQPIQPHWLLITADVESLYTNMQIPIILDSIREIFNNNPEAGRPDHGILELLEITLNNNDFEFDGNFYLQILGIA